MFRNLSNGPLSMIYSTIVCHWFHQLFTVVLLSGLALDGAAQSSSNLRSGKSNGIDRADQSQIKAAISKPIGLHIEVDERFRVSDPAEALADPTEHVAGRSFGRRASARRITSPAGCGNVQLHDRFGSISSPGYPRRPSNLSSILNCAWTIHVTSPSDVLTISLDDLQLNGPQCSVQSNASCCTDRLHIQSFAKGENGLSAGTEMLYCGGDGQSMVLQPIITSGLSARIVLTANTGSSTRGFHLTYAVAAKHSVTCMDGEFRCATGKCIPDIWRCNRKNECTDGSDEADCGDVCSEVTDVRCDPRFDGTIGSPGCFSFANDRCDGKWDCPLTGADEKGCNGCPTDMFSCKNGNSCFSERKRCDGIPDCGLDDYTDEIGCGLCPVGHVLCDPVSSATQCYDPLLHRCNGQADCPNAVDEIGCRSCAAKVLCASGFGCYERSERCNASPECSDSSDEKNCSSETCRPEHGSFLCANRRCIRAAWVCDRSNDCGDASDELSCLKNSVITAAIMGSLISGLLLVIAVSCACKFIASRAADESRAQDRPDGHLRSSDQNLLRLEPDTFFFREPPPSYSASVCGNLPVAFEAGERRRSRRSRRQRRRPPSPPSDLPVLSANADLVDSHLLTDQTNVFGSEQLTARTEQGVDVDRKSDDEASKDPADQGPDLTNGASDSHVRSLVNIELDSIATVHPVSQFECDQEPLLN